MASINWTVAQGANQYQVQASKDDFVSFKMDEIITDSLFITNPCTQINFDLP